MHVVAVTLCVAREGRRLRNSRTLSILVRAIYSARLCRLHRWSGSTVLADIPVLRCATRAPLRGSKAAAEPLHDRRAAQDAVHRRVEISYISLVRSVGSHNQRLESFLNVQWGSIGPNSANQAKKGGVDARDALNTTYYAHSIAREQIF